MKISFLPENYEAPRSSGGYMKMAEGENKFRILSQPVIGWEDWDTVEGKKVPIRFPMDQKPAKPIEAKKPIKHFWAFIVWNYNEERIQVLEITQASIRKGIEMLCNDSDWGDPFFYDLKVIKKGEGIDTEYVVNPLPHKPLSEAIKNEFRNKPCCLHNLFDNSDPFTCSPEEATRGIFDAPQEEIAAVATVSQEQLDLLHNAIGDNKAYMTKVLTHYRIGGLGKLPADQFELVLERATNAKTIRLQKEDSILEA